MNKSRSLLSLLSTIFTAGTGVLLFLLLLSGAFPHNPLNRIFLLSAHPSIPSAPPITHWTFYNTCASSPAGLNIDCGSNSPAHPIVPHENFGTEQGVPTDFIHRRNTYFYLSRFGYAFLIIALFWCLLALLAGLGGVCAGAAAAIAAVASGLSLLSVAFAASVLTAVVVMARDAFIGDGQEAHIGVKAMAFWWTCVALMFMSTIGYWIAFLSDRRHRHDGGAQRTRKGRFGMRGAHGSESGESGRGLYEKEREPTGYNSPPVLAADRSSYTRGR